MLAGVMSWPAAGGAQSVLFINPGHAKETYWRTASEAMQAAAESLGMQLEIHYAQRNPLKAIAIAKQVALRPIAARPRFVIFGNEGGVAPEMLRTLEAAKIDHFMAFSGLSDEGRSQLGQPREKFKHWLGSLEPKAEDAGYLTAKTLIEVGRANKAFSPQDSRLHLLAIAGDRSTPSSIARNTGMRKAVAEAADVKLEQEVFGEWSRHRAAEQMRGLMLRYPDVRLVWAGNDEMAFGAMDVWRAHAGTPGQDAFFSAINTSEAAFSAVRAGELSVLAGGHFMAGAWAMVMLYDYAHGKDFQAEGLELVRPMFVLFNVSQIERFEQRFGAMQKKPLDFRHYSKVLNPKESTYRFEIEKLLR